MANSYYQAHERSFEYLELITSADAEAKRCITLKYLRDCENQIISPDFKPGLEWFNTSEPLSLRSHLSNKLVVLDFFTYCCINCMHILPDLHELEERYSKNDSLVIIGVHSAKFDNEKLSSNVSNAVSRYGIKHPVVNDATAFLWDQMNISCWPSLVVLGPSNEILIILTGEGHRDTLFNFTEISLEYFESKGQISRMPVIGNSPTMNPSQSLLKFPGKVTTNGVLVAISDTGNHRLVLTDMLGNIQCTIGSGIQGFEDGDYEATKFNSPQGLCFYKDDTLFVADCGNHAIRKICLTSKETSTLVGDGNQGQDLRGGARGKCQRISSPWDVLCGKAPNTNPRDVLFIAMAGTHQIWLVFLEDCSWIDRRQYDGGTCIVFAGSGTEENRNNSYPLKASFAQPSGLTLGETHYGSSENNLYVADSESSCIRSISLSNGAVKNVAGGDIDPKNLFAYGDSDLAGLQAKFQHPLGVSYNNRRNEIIVADSYNHKLKVIELPSRICRTIDLQAQEDKLESQLNEPGGICFHPNEQLLFIADTNNHAIKTYSFESGAFSNFVVQETIGKSCDTEDSLITTLTSNKAEKLEEACVSFGGTVEVVLHSNFGHGFSLTEGAPSRWQAQIIGEESDSFIFKPEEEITTTESRIAIDAPSHAAYATCCVKTTIYYCSENGLCKMKTFFHEMPIKVEMTSPKTAICNIYYELV